MTCAWTDARRDRLLSLLAAGFAVTYISAARGIEDSLLSDAVGAGGVPQGVGIAMLVIAVALFAKSLRSRPAAKAAAGAAQDEADQAWQSVALRTAGLVAILVGYGLALPLLGYPLTLSLLVLASGRLAGAAMRWPLLLCAAVAGPLLWAVFDWALKVRMPVGSVWL
ncbi:MAG: tripartite tricarboxylate transporter TctB family protein [Rubrivivax sp.]